MTNIDQQKFIELSKTGDYVIVDVRKPEECDSGVLSNAQQINYLNHTLFDNEIKKLDKSKSYLIYCRSGKRSSMACAKMDTIGFVNTYNLEGGMLNWTGPLL